MRKLLLAVWFWTPGECIQEWWLYRVLKREVDAREIAPAVGLRTALKVADIWLAPEPPAQAGGGARAGGKSEEATT